MTSPRLSNPLALAVLVLLFERPMHPYEMSTTMRERRKEDSIKLNYGSLYSVVAVLEKHGLIAVKETLREGNRPERTIYRITEAGKDNAVSWLSDLISVPGKEFSQFEAALSLIGAIEPDEAIRLLELRLGSLELQRMSAEGIRAGIPASFPRIFLIETEYQRAHLETEVIFVRELIRDLRAETISGMKAWRRMHELRATDASPEEIAAQIADEFPMDPSWMEDSPVKT